MKKSFVETDRASQLHVLACTAAHRVSAGLTWRPHACTTLNDDVSPRALQISDGGRKRAPQDPAIQRPAQFAVANINRDASQAGKASGEFCDRRGRR